MKKYFALYLAPIAEIEKWMAKTTPEEMKASMEEWMKWMKDHEGIFSDVGAPLGKTKRLTAEGISDTKNDVTGYSIVEAETHEEAVKKLQGHPHLQIPGGSIEVMGVTEMPAT